jgi:CubicO group peptidase (beta-lactamase class C family)
MVDRSTCCLDGGYDHGDELQKGRAVSAVDGSVAPGYEDVGRAFAANFVTRGEVGAAFAATVGGEVVVDLRGGVADATSQRPWTPATVVPIFSGSKGIAAACMLLLIDRGLLDLHSTVARYWPRFARGGKGDVTVAQALSHRAGVPGIERPVTIEEAADHDAMAALVAAQRHRPAPSGALVYHALTFGWICGALVRCVDGRSLGTFFSDELARPLGLSAWIGMPPEHRARIAQVHAGEGFGPPSGELDPVGASIWANPPRFVAGELAANLAVWQEAEVPASNAIADARSMARLYAALPSLVRAETLALASTQLSRGHDPYLNAELAFSAGFQLPTDEGWLGPVRDAFGHCGTGGSVHGYWPRDDVAFSYTMNELRSQRGVDPRPQSLIAALHACTKTDARPCT